MRLSTLLALSILSHTATFAAGDERGSPSSPPSANPENISAESFRLLRRVYEYDPEIPLDGRIVQRNETKWGGPREKIVFRGVQGFYVPGYLQLPPNATGHVPCVLLLHGWSGSKENFWTDDNYIHGGNVRKALLAEGMAVLALDAQCHGDRIAQNEFAPVNPSGPAGTPPRKGYFSQREIYVQTTIDYRRALDYLKGRLEIDSARIGVLGYSMGGTQTFLLTAVEPRIKAAVACAVPQDLARDSLIAPRNFAHAVGSRPFLLIMGRHDEMCPAEEAQRILQAIGSPRAKLSFYEGTHKIDGNFVADAARWLKDHL